MKTTIRRLATYLFLTLGTLFATGCHESIATQAQSSFASFLISILTTVVNEAFTP